MKTFLHIQTQAFAETSRKLRFVSKHMHDNGFEAKICVMDRLRYGPYWRNKKAEVEQSIYKATLSNDQSSR